MRMSLNIFKYLAVWRTTDLGDPSSEYYWSEWGSCSVSCGEGVMRKQRECIRLKNGAIEEVLKENPEDHCGPAPGAADSDVVERPCFLKFCGKYITFRG